MFSVQAVADLVTRGADFYRHYVPADWIPYPNLGALAVAAAGLLLAFWGARLLRTIYILAFMVGGGIEGFQIGRRMGIDTLIGLTFGAGIAALIGHIFFRWWVGLTAGLVAVMVVLAVAWPRMQAIEQRYRDELQGVGTGDFSRALSGEPQTPSQYAAGLAGYIWSHRRDVDQRMVFAVIMALLLGIVLGVVLPRFTAILATSLVGVSATGLGMGVLLWRNLPELWGRMSGRPDWCLGALGLLLLISLWRQAQAGRPRSAAPVAPTPPGAPPAAAKAAK